MLLLFWVNLLEKYAVLMFFASKEIHFEGFFSSQSFPSSPSSISKQMLGELFAGDFGKLKLGAF